MPFPILAVASLAANAISSASSIRQQKKQAEQQQKNVEIQRTREDTAYQRSVADMKRAGLNPYGNSGLQPAQSAQPSAPLYDSAPYAQMGSSFDKLADAEQAQFSRDLQAEETEDKEINQAYISDLDNTGIDIRNSLNGLETCSNDFKEVIQNQSEETKASAISVRTDTQSVVEKASKREFTEDEIKTINDAYERGWNISTGEKKEHTDSAEHTDSSSTSVDGGIDAIISNLTDQSDQIADKQDESKIKNKGERHELLKEAGYEPVIERNRKTGEVRKRNVEVWRDKFGKEIEFKDGKCIKGKEHLESLKNKKRKERRFNPKGGVGFENGSTDKTAVTDSTSTETNSADTGKGSWSSGSTTENKRCLTKQELSRFSALTSHYFEQKQISKNARYATFYSSESYKRYQQNYSRYLGEYWYSRSYREYLRSNDGRNNYFDNYRKTLNLRKTKRH